jgi:hypothetical protein
MSGVKEYLNNILSIVIYCFDVHNAAAEIPLWVVTFLAFFNFFVAPLFFFFLVGPTAGTVFLEPPKIYYKHLADADVDADEHADGIYLI